MAVKQGLYSSLKNLGSLPWRKAVAEGLYNESLLLNKIPNADFINGDTVAEEVSNRKDGYYLKVILDLDFLKAKMTKHICKYFTKAQEKQYLEFCKQVWLEYQNQELEVLIQGLIEIKGGTREEWLVKLK